MSCGVGCRCSSDLILLWLWCRPADVALIRPLAWEPPYAKGAALKKSKKGKKSKKKKKLRNDMIGAVLQEEWSDAEIWAKYEWGEKAGQEAGRTIRSLLWLKSAVLREIKKLIKVWTGEPQGDRKECLNIKELTWFVNWLDRGGKKWLGYFLSGLLGLCWCH